MQVIASGSLRKYNFNTLADTLDNNWLTLNKLFYLNTGIIPNIINLENPQNSPKQNSSMAAMGVLINIIQMQKNY